MGRKKAPEHDILECSICSEIKVLRDRTSRMETVDPLQNLRIEVEESTGSFQAILLL